MIHGCFQSNQYLHSLYDLFDLEDDTSPESAEASLEMSGLTVEVTDNSAVVVDKVESSTT